VISNPDALPSPDARAAESFLGARLVSTASVPADRRLAFWREVVCQTIAGVKRGPSRADAHTMGASIAVPFPFKIFVISIFCTSWQIRSGSIEPPS
jgi:hypothetical protein